MVAELFLQGDDSEEDCFLRSIDVENVVIILVSPGFCIFGLTFQEMLAKYFSKGSVGHFYFEANTLSSHLALDFFGDMIRITSMLI